MSDLIKEKAYVSHFEELRVWKSSMEMVDTVYSITSGFPKEEIYGLTSQIRRSAVSIPSNIAEGSSRDSTRDFIRFISIAKGSLSELKTQIIIAKRQNFISSVDSKRILGYINDIGKMLSGLFKSLSSKL